MDILYSWVGHADLRSFSAQSDERVRKLVNAVIGVGAEDKPTEVPGPIETAVHDHAYDRIVLLWSYNEMTPAGEYAGFIGRQCRIVHLHITNPISYSEIYTAVDKTLTDTDNILDIHRHILLSSGTPAMGAVWLLLGKTKYPATFLQAYKGSIIQTDIPFDLKVDVIHKLLKSNDKAIGEIPDSMLADASGFREIVGNGEAMRKAVNTGRRVALHDVNVLLTGESGTGKELFARAIHLAGQRHGRPFIAVNCGALPQNLLESELFGYRKGAFTGAAREKDGLFKKADGGTLFLDEIGECPLEMQKTLLRVLQPPSGKSLTCREFIPVGGTEVVHSDVRIIAATNRNLLEAASSGRFRSDLYYRLASISICLPPLRERGSDIALIADHLLSRINAELAKGRGYVEKHFSVGAIRAMEVAGWPGNVRELLNAITQGAVMALGDTITAEDMGLDAGECGSPPPLVAIREVSDLNLDKAISELKRKFIMLAVEQSGNSKSKAYKLLGMKSYQRLDSMMKSLGMVDGFD